MITTLAIPTHNRAEQLRQTLASVGRLVLPPSVQFEVLVIDNRCTDNTAEVADKFARTAAFHVRRVEEKQLGLCFARNRALRDAKGELVIFFDDDVRIAPCWLEAFLRALTTFEADAVVGPVFPFFETEPPAFYSAQVLDSVTSAYSRKGEYAKILYGEEAHQIPGCNFGVRRNVALEVGGFDPQLDRIGRGLIGHGDWEFGHALVRSGKRVAYEPDCRVEHVISADKLLPASLRARWYGFGAAERALAFRHGKNIPRLTSAKCVARALRYALRSASARLLGERARAFELELKACRELGFARGLPSTSKRQS